MQAYYSINGQKTVSDLCAFLYGSLNYIVKLMVDNPFITGINFDAFGGVKVLYDNSISQLVPANLETPKPRIKTQGIYVVKQGQGLSDVAMHTYCGLDNFVKMMVDNGIEDMNIVPDDLLMRRQPLPQPFNARIISFDPTLTANPVVQNHNNNKNIVYATGYDFKKPVSSVLLQENGFNIELENGFNIELE